MRTRTPVDRNPTAHEDGHEMALEVQQKTAWRWRSRGARWGAQRGGKLGLGFDGALDEDKDGSVAAHVGRSGTVGENDGGSGGNKRGGAIATGTGCAQALRGVRKVAVRPVGSFARWPRAPSRRVGSARLNILGRTAHMGWALLTPSQ
jgi:hypothetical protein